MFFIYKITNDINGKSYVGFTGNLKRRLRSHQKCADSSKNKPLYRAIRKYGWENFTVTVVCASPDKLYARDFLEKKYIQEFRSHITQNGYNLTCGGEGCHGLIPWNKGTKGRYRWSDERRDRQLSEFVPWNKGKQGEYKLTKEHRDKMKGHVPWNKGKTGVYSEETLNKMRGNKNALGHYCSESRKKKIAAKNSRNWTVVSPSGDIENISNMVEHCKKHGLTMSAMSRVASGLKNHHKGWKCRRGW